MYNKCVELLIVTSVVLLKYTTHRAKALVLQEASELAFVGRYSELLCTTSTDSTGRPQLNQIMFPGAGT